MITLPQIKFIAFFFLTNTLFIQNTEGLNITDKYIRFTPKRVELTRAYRSEHYGIENSSIQIIPKMIIVHWTALDDFNSSFNAFNREELPKTSRKDISSKSQLGVSAHFLIDRDGSIYRLMPETWMARHCIGLNHLAIGIENVGGKNHKENLTPEQLKANQELIRYLKNKYPSITHLIGHYEYLQYKNSTFWKENNNNYRTIKVDPGKRFMHDLRKKLLDLNLEPIFQNELDSN